MFAVTVPGDEDPLILFKSLYGLRCAPSLWSAEFATSLLELWFVRSKVDVAVFIRKSTVADYELGDMLVVDHIDDAAVFGERTSCDRLLACLCGMYKLKHEIHLDDEGGSAPLLGMTLHKTKCGFFISNDTSLLSGFLKTFGLDERSKLAATPAEVETEPTPESEEKLSSSQASEFRSVLGRLMWLSHDRPDLKFAVCRLSTHLSAPTQSSWTMAK
eukprot:4658403-Amphidinium_carterae.3